MNARSQVFELELETRQVQEAVLSLFHTVLFHRTLPKYNFQSGADDSWVLGTLGFQDVDCEHIDHTYVRTQSDELDALLKRHVADFYEDLRHGGCATPAGQVSLEFFQKKKKWPNPFAAEEQIPWEVWTVKTQIVRGGGVEFQKRLAGLLADKVMYVAEVVNRHEYVPIMYNKSNLDLIYDVSFADVQPYLFKVSHTCAEQPASPSVGTSIKRFVKDSLAF